MMSRTVKRPKKGKKVAAPAAAKGEMSDKEYAKLLVDAQQMVDEMNLDGAILLYEEALEYRPDDTRVMDALGEALYHCGQMERAEAVLSQSAESAPTEGYTKWMYLGQIYEGAESYEALMRGVGLLEAELERLSTAAPGGAGETTETSELARIRRELSDGYCSLAEIFMTDMCDEDEAEAKSEEYAMKAGQIDAANPEAYRVLANVRLCQNKKDEAAPLLVKSVELIESLYPEDEDAEGEEGPTTIKSTAAFAATQAAMAAAGDSTIMFDKIMQIPPYDARLQLAKNCMEVEQWEPAVTILERLLEEDDSNMEVFYLAGEANYYSGDVETALERLTTADEVLAAAIYQAGIVSRKAGKVKPSPVSAHITVPPELLELGLDELQAQQGMMQKLMAVVKGESAPHEVAAPGASMSDETLT